MKKLLALVLLLGLALFAAVASDRPSPRADLTYIEVQDVQTLDPQRMTFVQDLRLAYALFEGLVRWDIHSPEFTIVPAAAERWEVSADGLTYTFHLRESARWSTGEPLVARDFQRAWLRALMPDTAADYTALFFRIRGAQEFFDWRAAQLRDYAARPPAERTRAAAEAIARDAEARFNEAVAIETPDDRTLRVTLTRPTPYFLDLCAFATFLPVHVSVIDRYTSADPSSGALRQDHGWTKPNALITNGPYILKEWRFKRELLLERSPTYTGSALARSRRIRMLPIGDENTSVLAYKTGAADWHGDVNVDYIPELIEQANSGERADFHWYPAFGTYFWNFNCAQRLPDGRENPFADARVRRAFALAIDRRALTEKVRRRGEPARDTLIPPGGIAGYPSPSGLPYDPARAKRELEAAGWSDRDADGVPENSRGEPFPEVGMLVPGAPGHHKDTALALGRMWQSTLGVRTRVDIKESKAIKQDLRQRNYFTSRAIWFGDYGDPTTFLDLNRADDGNNDRGFNSPRYDAMLDAAELEPDPAKRLSLLADAERLLLQEEVPLVPLYGMMEFHFNRANVRGLSTHPRLVQYLWAIEVDGTPTETRAPFAGGGAGGGS